MQQILSVWNALSPGRRALVAGATLAMFLSVLVLARLAATPGMALLYAGLENGPAGEVVRALEARGVPYEVRGGSIFVAEPQRDELRLTLASEGLPANSTKGYELLDSLSGFGTTSQMFDAAYWRAKEGELARTILSSRDIASARVHIANTASDPFRRDARPTASVAVAASSGAITPEQARALSHLVASAVPGLAPADVAVIDSINGVVSSSDTPTGQPGTSPDRTAALRDRVQRLVEARVGRGNAVVEVAIDTVTESETLRERRIDPESRIAISSETEERTTSADEAGGGGVTVASNLPDGDAAEGEKSSRRESETRERVNYEVSETEREVLRAPGAIRRLSVAVMVNGTMAEDETGAEVFAPLPEAELDALRELVAAAVGFDEARGDRITLRSMPFEPSLPAGTAGSVSWADRLGLDAMRAIQLAVLAAVALILGLFVVRPVLAGARDAAPALPAPGGDGAENAGTLDGEISMGNAFELPELPELPALTADGAGDGAQEDPVARLRELIDQRREEAAQVLHSWLADRPGRAP